MAIEYYEAENALRRIAEAAEAEHKRLAQAQAALVNVDEALASLAARHRGVIDEIDAQATKDSAWAGLKTRKDALVASYQRLRTRATALRTAVEEATE